MPPNYDSQIKSISEKLQQLIGSAKSIFGDKIKIPGVMPASVIETAGNVNLPKEKGFDLNAALTSAQNLFGFQTDSMKTLAEERTKLNDSLKTSLGELEGKEDFVAKELERLGVPKDIETLRGLNTSIANDIGELSTGVQKIGDQAIPTGLIAGQQGRLKSEIKARIDAKQAQAAALQGNIELATKLANQSVTSHFAPIEQKIKNTLAYLEQNKDDFSAEEKRRADVVEQVLKEKQIEIDNAKQERSKVMDLLIKYPNIASMGITPDTPLQEAIGKAKPFIEEADMEKNVITLSEAKQFGLPPSLVGLSEKKFVQSLQSEEVPQWFKDMVQGSVGGLVITSKGKENQIKKRWNEFRNKSFSGSKSSGSDFDFGSLSLPPPIQ